MEVLVFDHVKYMEVSPQLPSGTVEPDEDIKAAALRELEEESGLSPKTDLHFIDRYIFFKTYNQQYQERNIFVLSDPSIPETWTHIVTGQGQDQNLEFRYYWLPLEIAKAKLQANLADGFTMFSEKINSVL